MNRNYSFFGRVLLSLIFVLSGLAKIVGFRGSVQYLIAHALPIPRTLLCVAIAIELVVGVLLMIGFRARTAAAILFLYLIPVTLIFHGFWNYAGVEASLQLANFLKNLAIMGGLLNVVAWGAGAASVDSLRAERRALGEAERRERIRRVS